MPSEIIEIILFICLIYGVYDGLKKIKSNKKIYHSHNTSFFGFIFYE